MDTLSKSPIPSSITDNCQPQIDIKIPPLENDDLISKYIVIPNKLFSLELNILDIDDIFILRNIVCKIFEVFFEKVNFTKINVLQFKLFVKDVADNYHAVPYHNFYHATHILHFVYILIDKCDLFNKLNTNVSFALLLAALVHDIDHPGNNNIYEINTCSELACRYNDLSVLEQHHCHLAFGLIKKHNLFEHFTHEDFIICRKTIITSILGTDMTNHKQIIETIKYKKQFKFNFDTIEEQYLISKILLHAADIGNPALMHDLSAVWAKQISMEFYLQTQKEKERGIKPFTSFNIGSPLSFYSHEVKYIIYICKPYWEELVTIFESLKPMLNEIDTNLIIYEENIERLELLEKEQSLYMD